MHYHLYWGSGVLSTGYIKTQDHDKGRYYAMNVVTWAHIAVLLGHMTLLSIRRLGMPTNSNRLNILEAFDGSQDSEHQVWSTDGESIPPPRVFQAHLVFVFFKHTADGRFEGLQLVFMHHLVWKWKLRHKSFCV